MKKLTIITRRFPYFYTEAFLESEYPYLKAGFDQLVFVPIFKGVIRESCKDAVVCDDYNAFYENKKIEVIKTIFSCHFYKSLLKNLGTLLRKGVIYKLIHQDTHYRILKRVIKKNPNMFDENTIVYSYWFDSQVYALIKLREDYGLKYKVITRAHRYDVYDEDGEMPNRKYCIQQIDRVLPISQDAINYFVGKYGNSEKFSLARLGVKDPGIASITSTFGSINFISVSQVSERKRILTIFRTLSSFAEQIPSKNIKWVHFGDGPLDEQLKKCVQGNTVKNFSIYLGGRVANTEIKEYFAKNEIDVFINLSSSEGVPVSVMEALSYGIPVVATNVGGTAEIMSENNGVLLSPNPTDNDIVEAYKQCINSNFDRVKIREEWAKTSDAEVQFTKFINTIKMI